MNTTDRTILEFEASHPEQGVTKRNAVRIELGMKPVRYEQALNRILGTREALQIAPMVVHRWERMQAVSGARRAARSFR